MKILMLRGLPASMKTTWAKQFQKESGNYIIVSREDICKMFGESVSKREKDVLRMRNEMIRAGIKMRKNVIVDDTNLNPKHEKYLRQLARELGVRFEINDSFLQQTPESCIERDLHRGEKAVGASTIWRLYYKWVAPNPIRKLEQNFDKPRAIICDLDSGLMVCNENRNFYSMDKINEDNLNPAVGCIIDALHNYGMESNGKPYPTIIFISSRNESSRKATEEWLDKNLIPYDFLYMRGQNDSRPDEIIKEEIYHKYIQPYFAVLCCIDGHSGVCRNVWRKLGLMTLQIGNPEVDF